MSVINAELIERLMTKSNDRTRLIKTVMYYQFYDEKVVDCMKAETKKLCIKIT